MRLRRVGSVGGTTVRQSEGVAMYGGRDECLRAAVAVVSVPLLVGRAIMLDLKHKPISLFQERT